MKKEDFLKLGLDEEMAIKCANASAEELKAYIPKTRFDEVNNEKKRLELDVRDRDGQLETLKNSSGDVEEMKKQIETLQADNKKKDEEHAAEIKQLKVDAAVESAILNAKGKNTKAIKVLLDLDNVEFEEDGSVKGLTKQLEALVKADDSKFLFEQEESNLQLLKGFNPGNASSSKAGNLSDMKYSEMVAYLAENPGAKI